MAVCRKLLVVESYRIHDLGGVICNIGQSFGSVGCVHGKVLPVMPFLLREWRYACSDWIGVGGIPPFAGTRETDAGLPSGYCRFFPECVW